MVFDEISCIARGSIEEECYFKRVCASRLFGDLEEEDKKWWSDSNCNPDNKAPLTFIFCYSNMRRKTVLGMMSAILFSDGPCIQFLYVQPRSRRQGICKAMLGMFVRTHAVAHYRRAQTKAGTQPFEMCASVAISRANRYHNWDGRLRYLQKHADCRIFVTYSVKIRNMPSNPLPKKMRLLEMGDHFSETWPDEYRFYCRALDYLHESRHGFPCPGLFDAGTQLLFHYGGPNNDEILGVVTSAGKCAYIETAFVAERARSRGVLTCLSEHAHVMWPKAGKPDTLECGVAYGNTTMRNIMEERRKARIKSIEIHWMIAEKWLPHSAADALPDAAGMQATTRRGISQSGMEYEHAHCRRERLAAVWKPG